MKYVLYIITFLIFGCASGKQQNYTQEIQFETLVQGSNGGYLNNEFIIVKNQDELKTVYTQINKVRKPGFPIPKIDFEKELILALFLGEKTTGGHAISITKIIETIDEVQVFVQTNAPDGMATSAMTQPYYFCKIPRTEKSIVFK
ncbi:MAG: hypothetical protein BM563_08115 [Bacteroidetes bacterium MedPE-SWsnd-G1]|nr:MAG: hypothetical protein BM563_08115 [Bacteroidetes bacterium MedPE-SWsnd-G1]